MPVPLECELGQAGDVGMRIHTPEAFPSRAGSAFRSSLFKQPAEFGLSFSIILFLADHGEPTKSFPPFDVFRDSRELDGAPG